MTLNVEEESRIIPFYLSSFPFIRQPQCAHLLLRFSKWRQRFPTFFDDSVYNELAIFFNFISTSFLERHSTSHLFRLLLSINTFRSKLVQHLSFNSLTRHVLLKFLPTHLIFPFSSKSALGCLIGVTLKNSQEILTSDDFQALTDKLFPHYQLIPGMTYFHPDSHSSIKWIYFELEKKTGGSFNLQEREQIRETLTARLEGELPRLIRPIFAPRNQEEVYKNILLLSQEIRSTEDLPHAMISLDQQKDEELVFLINLVYVSSSRLISLENLFNQEHPRAKFVSEHFFPVTLLENRFPVLSHTFRLHITDHSSFHRSDGSLHFYEARKYISDLLFRAIGEFRDCNGGLLIKMDEQLSLLKERFAPLVKNDAEIIETLFYSIVPLEKQATLATPLIQEFFAQFLKALEFRPTHASGYYYVQDIQSDYVLCSVRLPPSTIQETVRAAFEELTLKTELPISWSMVETRGALSITFLIEQTSSPVIEAYLNAVQDILERWSQQVEGHRVCRIVLSPKAPSLDPRLGSDEHSGNLLRMLFEGLTRLNRFGQVEGAIAESISITSNGREYLFKLRSSFWNDGSPLTAHDFAYSWRKTLSPEFSLSFAYFLYPIQNAQAVKEGLLSEDTLGIEVIDDHQLKITLEHPVAYFLELVAHPICFPVHRFIDQQSPHWTSEIGSSYPCNGPFQIMTNHPNYGYQLVKNPRYWDTNNFPLDQMVFLCAKPGEVPNLFLKGDIDLIGSPFDASAFDMDRVLYGERHLSKNNISAWCLFNTEKFPFNHLKFRQALSLAIHPSKLFKVDYPSAEFNLSLLPPDLSLMPPTPALGLSPDYIKILLSEFLEENRLKKEDIPPLTLLYTEREENLTIALKLKHVWEEVLGFPCKMEEESWDRLYKRYKAGDYQMGLLWWMSRFNDPIYTLNAFRHSSKVVNFSRWNNAQYQVLLDQSDNLLNNEERKELLKKAEHLLNQELPALPLLHTPCQCIKRPGIDTTFLTRCGFYKF